MVEALDLSALLPTLVPVPAGGVNVTLSGGSTLAVVVFSVANEALATVRDAVVATLGTPALASAALQIAVLDVAPVAYSEGCAADGSDDTCDDWSEAAWSSYVAEYRAPLPPGSKLPFPVSPARECARRLLPLRRDARRARTSALAVAARRPDGRLFQRQRIL